MSRARQAAQNNRPVEETIKFIHIWSLDVREFDQYEFNDDYFGPIFATVHSQCALRWRLLIKPKGGQYTDSEIEFRDSIGIFLEQLDSVKPVVVSFKCFIISASDAHVSTLVNDRKMFSADTSTWGCYADATELPQDLTEMKEIGLIANDQQLLQIGVQLSIPVSAFDLLSLLDVGPPLLFSAAGAYQFSNILLPSYAANTSNYRLVSNDNQTFYVHKDVLYCSCPYFKTLFARRQEGKYKEEDGETVFEDVDGEVLKEILRFIYTSQTNLQGFDLLYGVLYAAEKFGLDNLKTICEKHMMEFTEPKRTLLYLSTADRFNLIFAKNRALCRAVDFWDLLNGSEDANEIRRDGFQQEDQEMKITETVLDQITKLAIEKSRVNRCLDIAL